MKLLHSLWNQAVLVQPRPALWMILLTLGAAVAGILPRRAWRVTRNAVTIAHEGAHAIVARCTGRQLDGIKLHSDTSGVTVSAGRPTGLGMILTAFAGYPGPSLLGLAAAAVLRTRHADALALGTVVLLAVMLTKIRNLFGALTVLVTGGLLGAAVVYAPSVVVSGVAYLLAWFLLVSGLRPVVELQAKRAREDTPDSDADQLARLTGLPGLLWVGLFGVVSVGALLLGGKWLLLG